MIRRQKNLTHGERQIELRLSKLHKRRLKRYFASSYQYQMMESKGGRATLLSAAQVEIQEMQFQYKVVFFHMRVVKHCNKLPRVCMESPSLEGLRTPLDTLQSNLL